MYERRGYVGQYINKATTTYLANGITRLQLCQHPQKLLRDAMSDASLGLRADGRRFM